MRQMQQPKFRTDSSILKYRKPDKYYLLTLLEQLNVNVIKM